MLLTKPDFPRGIVFAFLAALTACNGAAGPSGAPSAPPGGSSWVHSDAKKQRLMYVSDPGTGDVYIYQVSNDALVGTLTGFGNQLSGMCVADGQAILEFAHGGTQVIGEFSPGGGVTGSCSVDPSTGNVAMGVIYYGSAPGFVYICPAGKGCTQYNPHILSYVDFVSYNKNGLLYADGANDGRSGFAMAQFYSGNSINLSSKERRSKIPAESLTQMVSCRSETVTRPYIKSLRTAR